MTILGKKQMSEEDIKLNYITPVILDGWKGHITMETKITDGRINISGNIVARSKPKFADYMLYLNDGKPIAVRAASALQDIQNPHRLPRHLPGVSSLPG